MSPDGLKKELSWKTVALGLFGGRRNGARDGLGMARGAVFMGALGLVLVGATLGGQEVFATASSLTLSISGNPTINLPPSAEGKFADSGDQTISVSTTHAAGYVLKVKASDTTTLKNTSGTVGFTSISSAISEETFDTSAYNGKWGYKPSKLNGAANTNYLPSPTTTGSTIDSVSSATSNNYTVSIGARADINTAIDNYSNTFVFTVTANPTPYTITYNANTTDTVSNMPSNTTASAATEAVAISSNSPTRSGWYFTGWNTSASGDGTSYAKGGSFTLDQTATNNTLTLYAQWTDCRAGYICYKSNAGTDTVAGTMADQSVGTSATSAMLRAYNYKRDGYAFLGWSTTENPTIGTDTIYGPMETISFSALSASGLKLYAVWLPKSTEYTMQTFSSSICSTKLTAVTYNSTSATFTATANSFIALEDTRDGDVYAVARLSDGNCWMLENLRLDDSVSADAIASGSQGVGGDFTKLASSEDTNFANSTTANSLYSTENGLTMPRFNKNNTNIGGTNASGTTLTPSYNSNNNTAQWYGYGNYYTWAAAKANTTAMDDATASDSVATSLCPTNWRLPIGYSTATYSFGALSTSMGGLSSYMDSSSTPTGAVMSARLRQFPNNFVYSGFWYSSSASARGSFGYYWSSTAYVSSTAYYLGLYSTGVRPGTNRFTKYYGSSVRCVAGS